MRLSLLVRGMIIVRRGAGVWRWVDYWLKKPRALIKREVATYEKDKMQNV